MSGFESKATRCSRCSAALPASGLEGLCPRCLMVLNLSTDATPPGGDAGAAAAKPVPPAPAQPEAIARFFPQLEILECLGRGGMGAVYKARQPLLQRCVALKILAPEKEKDPRFAERFMREAQALARLNHPNIVTVYDFGETNGLYYLLMEFVDGMNLRQLLHQRKLAPEQALTIVPAICEALQYAHQQGIVHRDIKPENVLLDKQGRVKIADFGIAKLLGQAAEGPALTGAKEVVGTAYYMAPEQVESPQTVDHRADIYSLGVVFYEMLTGELPLGRFAPPSRKAQSDVRLDEVVLRALEKEPARRYQQASQVKSDVETIATQTGQAGGQAFPSAGEREAQTPEASTGPIADAVAFVPKTGRRKKAVLLSACGLALLLLGLVFFLTRTKDTPWFPWTVAFLPDGKTLVSGGGQRRLSPMPAHGELVFWNLATGKRRRVIGQDWGIRSLTCSHDGKFLVLGQANGLTRLVDLQTSKTLATFMPAAFINSVTVSADNQLVASGSFDGTVTLWDVGRRHQETLVVPNEVVLSVAISPDRTALVTTTKSGRAYLFDLAQRGEPRVLATWPGQLRGDPNAEGVAFAPDGLTFATVCQRSVRLWATQSAKLVREWQGSGSATFLGLAFAPDGHSLATVDSDGVLTLWNPDTGESQGNVKAHEGNSYTVVFSPDGKRLATTGIGDYAIKLWDAQTLAPVKSFVRATAGHPGGASAKRSE